MGELTFFLFALDSGAVMGETSSPKIDFITFILSLASSVQVHLGKVANPETKQFTKNLELARQSIELLALLQEKTKGNLSADESKLLDHLVYDLKMQYVEVSR